LKENKRMLNFRLLCWGIGNRKLFCWTFWCYELYWIFWV